MFIPGCYGGVNNGPQGCVCDRDKLKRARIDRLEARVKKLEKTLQNARSKTQDRVDV